MPEVCTEHLILREFRDSDVDPLYAIQGDREHMRFTHWVESREECEAWMRRHAEARRVNGFAPWTIVHLVEGRVIGWGGLNVDPYAPGWGPEISYFIHRDYQGRGFATELVRASLRCGFAEHGLRRVGAFTKRENRASARVLEKCGFVFVRYEPALERNHYEIPIENWRRSAM